jgi:hypothetical protein
MTSMEQQVDELTIEELNGILCIRCLASGLPVKDALYDSSNMKPSRFTEGLICEKHYQAEEEGVYKKMPRDIFDYFSMIVRRFNERKE